MSLTADSRQSVCDTLATYSGPDVDPWFSGLVKLAHRKQVATGSTTQMETDGKRKRDDGSDVAQPRSKKPRPAESTASSEPGDTDGVWSPSGSLLYALAEPTSSVSATASSSVAPLSPETRSNTVRENSSNTPVKPASSTANSAFNFGQSAPIKRETSVEQPSDCDEQLTCADRAPRKLKCIQCKEFYMEDQNTAMECRRHPGTRPVSSCSLVPAGRQGGPNSLLTFPCRSLRRCQRQEILLS